MRIGVQVTQAVNVDVEIVFSFQFNWKTILNNLMAFCHPTLTHVKVVCDYIIYIDSFLSCGNVNPHT